MDETPGNIFMKNSKSGSACMGPIILYTSGQNKVNFHEKTDLKLDVSKA